MWWDFIELQCRMWAWGTSSSRSHNSEKLLVWKQIRLQSQISISCGIDGCENWYDHAGWIVSKCVNIKGKPKSPLLARKHINCQSRVSTFWDTMWLKTWVFGATWKTISGWNVTFVSIRIISYQIFQTTISFLKFWRAVVKSHLYRLKFVLIKTLQTTICFLKFWRAVDSKPHSRQNRTQPAMRTRYPSSSMPQGRAP
jgi:hypothetical protein